MAYVPYCAYCVVVFVVFVCVCVWRALWEGGEGIVLIFMLSTHSPGHTLHGVDSSQHDTRRVVLRSVRVCGSPVPPLVPFQSATALQDSGGGAKQRVSAVPGSSAEVDLDGTRDSTELAIVYYVQKFCRTRVAVTREPCGLWRLLEFTVADCVLYKVSIPRLFRNYNHTTCTHNSYEGGSAQGVVRVV